MSNPASPQLLRALVDFYQGGQLLYKKDNVYPADERLELMKARGEAQAYTPPVAAPAKAAQQAGKRARPGAAESSGQSSGSPVDEAGALVSNAGGAGAVKDPGESAGETAKAPAQEVATQVAQSEAQPVKA